MEETIEIYLMQFEIPFNCETNIEKYIFGIQFCNHHIAL